MFFYLLVCICSIVAGILLTQFVDFMPWDRTFNVLFGFGGLFIFVGLVSSKFIVSLGVIMIGISVGIFIHAVFEILKMKR